MKKSEDKARRQRDNSDSSRSSSRSSRSSRHHHSRRKSRKRSRSSSRDKKERSKSHKNEYVGTNSKDPKMVASRIFIGNLPTDGDLKRDDVEAVFKKYGKIIGLLLMSGYAFVQFDNVESALLSKQENGKVLKGGTIEVRVASEKRKMYGNNNNNNSGNENPAIFRDPFYPGYFRPVPPPFIGGRVPPPFYPPDPFMRPPMVPPLPGSADYYRPPSLPTSPLPPIPQTNKPLAVPIDCEIILVDEAQRAYGEVVMKRLMSSGLAVEAKALPFDLNTLGMVEAAGRKGILFAIIVNEQNEMHRSITVNILHGSPQEHRNMPLEDALALITRSFDKYVITKKERLAAANQMNKVFTPPGQNIVYLLNLLADSRFLSVKELDLVLDYLVDRRNILAKSEGLPIWPDIGQPQKAPSHSPCFIESRKVIDDNHISMNSYRPEPPSMKPSLQAPSTTSNVDEKSCKGLAAVFDNPLVQKALDNLLTSGPSLLKVVAGSKQQQPQQSQQQQQRQQHKDYSEYQQYSQHKAQQRFPTPNDSQYKSMSQIMSNQPQRFYSQQSHQNRNDLDDYEDKSWLSYARN